MKKFALFVMSFFVAFIPNTFAQKQTTSKNVVATINGHPIIKNQVYELLAEVYPPVHNEILRVLATRHIIREETKREKIEIKKQKIIKLVIRDMNLIKKKLKSTKITWEQYLESRKITEKEFKRKAFIDYKYKEVLTQLIRLYELRHVRIEARHIMVKTENEAKKILERLEREADFEILARRKSLCKTKDEKRPGRLPLIMRGDHLIFKGSLLSASKKYAYVPIPKQLENALWKLQSGKKVIRKIDNHYHIIEILKKYSGHKGSWQKLSSKIDKSLKKSPITNNRALQRWLKYMEKNFYKIEKK